ncbi:CENP-B homolog protein 2-like [Rhizophagus clarus]|uniref:CENP-B homolog protein 2-like n=1 Tax=Rhizophagus clarus TaxID=94130 RepID=A0A8H3M229_9GLOM|nr:CENP-B homolog protein 2-like [Rhizophagus clarus]
MCLELELALKEFVLRYQHQTILSDAILIEKAKLLASELGVPEDTLQFSSSWLQGFKKRNGILNVQAILLKEFTIWMKQGFFTGILLEPDQTLATKRIFRQKKNKKRLSIALCANADRSHKLDPLIIGKFAKPRCFKNININNLPMKYRNNNKAWMIITFFQEWLQEFDYQVAQKHRDQCVLLLLDNCSSHKLQETLPLLSYSILKQVEAGERAQDLKMSVLQAIQYIIQGWNNVTAETIYNCWHHTKILPIDTNVDPNFPLDDRDVSDELTNALNALNFLDVMELEEYLTISEENIVSKIHDDDEIIAEIVNNFKKKSNENNTDNDLDEVNDSIKEEVISFNIVLKSLKKVNTFLLQQENAYEKLKLVNLLEKFVKKKQKNSMP